jgi:type VI protein secretion system component VasF
VRQIRENHAAIRENMRVVRQQNAEPRRLWAALPTWRRVLVVVTMAVLALLLLSSAKARGLQAISMASPSLRVDVLAVSAVMTTPPHRRHDLIVVGSQ